MRTESDEQRLMPRFPLPKEKIKFHFEEVEKVFAVRDISIKGLGINLLEFGESAFFPLGYQCGAELKLAGESFHVKVKVARVSAWSIGFTFEELSEFDLERISNFINPLQIGSSLRLVDSRIAPEAFLQGMSAWYHGDSGTDFFFWNARGGVDRALLCFGKNFWEWREEEGVCTGEIERMEGDKVVLHKDATPDPKTRELVRKVLEHAEVLDYRLVTFLKEKT